jgi:hypothetical protein
MDKSKIFIASSRRTLLLAEKLRDELSTEFCEARLWSEEGRRQPGATIIEMLESATEQYDFAAIILAKDDVITGGEGETLKARDNCVFEAGLFMAAIGRRRCFLVNSVRQSDLPSDLNGIISLPFQEPANLEDRRACADAIKIVGTQLKDVIQTEGPCAFHARLPLLSVDEMFRREQPLSDGGELEAGQVIVLDTQPWAEVRRAELVRRNMNNGTSYHYFLYFSDDTVDKICLSLQMLAWSGVSEGADSDFTARIDRIRNTKDRVLNDLGNLCRTGLLRISLMVDSPVFCFRVHNASNPTRAQFYSNFQNKAFALWAKGQEASTLWRTIPKYLEEDTGDRIFLPLKFPVFDDDQRQRLKSVLSRGLRRYFAEIGPEVEKICLG